MRRFARTLMDCEDGGDDPQPASSRLRATTPERWCTRRPPGVGRSPARPPTEP